MVRAQHMLAVLKIMEKIYILILSTQFKALLCKICSSSFIVIIHGIFLSESNSNKHSLLKPHHNPERWVLFQFKRRK